jgi:purine-binding chemotaxis protein CheW
MTTSQFPHPAHATPAQLDAPAPAPRALRGSEGPSAGPAQTPGMLECLVFRVGPELFALDLTTVEEAVELPRVHHVPEMPGAMLGVFNLRDRLLPVYSPTPALGVVLAAENAVALVLHVLDRRLGLAVDDVEDVLTIDLSQLRRPPIPESRENVLLGVARNGGELISLVQGEALALTCLAEHSTEAA